MTHLTPHQPPPPVQIQPRSPAVGIILSFFIPGLGSMYAGSGGVGTIILVSYLISWLLTLVFIGFILVPVVWIWGMIHGHMAAVRWNADHGIIS